MVYGDETLEWLVEWFEESPSFYGPVAIPTFLEVLRGLPTTEWHYGRAASTEILEQIALQYPAARMQVIEGLRALLPALGPDGELVWGEEADLVDGNWALIAGALGALQDWESQPTVAALLAEELIDEEILDEETYLSLLNGLGAGVRPRFDIVQFYAGLVPPAPE